MTQTANHFVEEVEKPHLTVDYFITPGIVELTFWASGPVCVRGLNYLKQVYVENADWTLT